MIASAKRPAAKKLEPARDISAASSRRRQQRIDDKRAVILAAALTLFSTYGLHGTSLDQIALKADVSKSNLLYYFAGKDDLYVSLLSELLTDWISPLSTFSSGQDPQDAIFAYIRRKLEFSRDNPEASRLFCIEIMQGAPLLGAELQTRLRQLVQAKSAVIEDWVRQGKLRAVSPQHLFYSLWSITQHYADFQVQIKAISGKTLSNAGFFEEAVQHVQSLIWAGIQAPEASKPRARK